MRLNWANLRTRIASGIEPSRQMFRLATASFFFGAPDGKLLLADGWSAKTATIWLLNVTVSFPAG